MAKKIVKMKIFTRKEDYYWTCSHCCKEISPNVTHSHRPYWSQGMQMLADYHDAGEPYNLVVVEDTEWDAMSKDNNKFPPLDQSVKSIVEEKDETYAQAQVDANRPQREKINDEQAVLAVITKVRNSEVLTSDDLKVIDPDDSTPGVTKSRRLLVSDYL